MPREERRKIGEIHTVRQVPTIWDKIKEAIGAIAGLAVVIWIIASLIT